MPELPEVETIKRVIEPQIQSLIIKKVEINRPEVIACPAAETFGELLSGQVISHMERRGKFLIFLLDSGDRVVLHLRMTGCLLLTPADMPEEKHTHIVFSLSSGQELRFSDTRRFGRLWLLRKGEDDTCSGIDKLGIEPLDAGFNAEYLRGRLGKRKKSIKNCLLDQSIVAGIGNIYSDEILFAAGIDPSCPANGLLQEDWERLVAAIPERLAYFIEKNQLTPEEYLRTKGKEYRNTPFLRVYGHEGQPCPICGEPLCRKTVGGRSSTYCPNCQKGSSGERLEKPGAL